MAIEIERRTSADLVPPILKPAIDGVIEIYKQAYDHRLYSVYLIGSAARGEYKPGISDFDMRAIVESTTKEEADETTLTADPFRQMYNIAKIEMDVYPKSKLDQRDWLQFYLINDGICVYGKPYEPALEMPTTKEELAEMLSSHLLRHYEEMPRALVELNNGALPDPEEWKKFAKRAIRIANAVSILRTGQYTQNSDRMFNNILLNVPEIGDAIKQLNEFRQNAPQTREEYDRLFQLAQIVEQFAVSQGLGD